MLSIISMENKIKLNLSDNAFYYFYIVFYNLYAHSSMLICE